MRKRKIRVSRVRDNRLKMDYPWMYDIRTKDELMDYWEEVAKPRWGKGFVDFQQHHERGEGHGETVEGNFLMSTSFRTGKSPIEVLGKIQMDLYLAQENSIPILINKNGGYFSPGDSIEFLQTQEIENWILPDDEVISITKWPNGTHWYAKVGDQEVEFNGARKWMTKEGAEIAAREFRKEREIEK